MRGLVSKTKKVVSRKTITIEWGDCDPAQIVHFPRYFSYFDACTTALFKKAGLRKREMLKTYQIIGIPMVDVRASFIAPSRFSDAVVVESEITEWRRSSFCVRHRLFNKKVLAVECLETRVWAVQSPLDKEKIESKPVPQDVIARFSGDRKNDRKDDQIHVKSRRQKQ
jgi:4-hydroxybenzoyl-CoA thioesterase